MKTNEGIVTSPGRVNLLGEHVDYNGGIVLPAAIDRSVKITFERAGSSLVNISALDLNDHCQFSIEDLDAKITSNGSSLPGWALYPAGVLWSLRQYGCQLEGFNAQFTSSIPIGAGLSSSAAVEVGFAVVCDSLGGWQLDRLEIAKLCQHAEREYVGVNCGLMDQFACACGVADHVVMLDTRSLENRPVPLPKDTAVVIADSGIRRTLVTSAYNERRIDCESALAYFNKIDPRITSLRDLDSELFARHENQLPHQVAKRARHIVEEIARVDNALVLLENNDAVGFGALMLEAHTSLRDLYEVSIPELNILVEEAMLIEGCYGARLTGAGFGGCTVSLVKASQVNEFIPKLIYMYNQRTGLKAAVFATHASRGAFLHV